jgi:glycosyltransferase involved in cell wall biosynthesis
MGVAMQPDNEPTSGGQRLKGILAQSTTDLPLVTVVTAVYNGQPHVAGCLESVLTQDYPNIEHIIVDGGSTDGTLDVLRSREDRIALWVSGSDCGVFDAWNKGLDLANGEWITFLGADDIYLPGAISTYVDLARNNPEAEFLSSRAKLDHPTGYSPIFGDPWAWPRFGTAMSTIHVGTMHHRSLFERLGRFDRTYRIAGDYEFMLRAKDTLKTAFTPEVTVVMRAGGLSDSTAGLHEARRAKVENGIRTRLVAEFELRRAITRFHLRQLYLKLYATLAPNRPTRLFRGDLTRLNDISSKE